MLEMAIVRSKSPTIELKALIEYQDRDLAKNAGFIWNSQRRGWYRSIRECDLENFACACSFEEVK